MNIWVYLFGERNGADIKVGYSKKPNLAERLKEVNDDQTTSESYVVLAAAVGSLKEEKAIKRYFAPIQRKTKGTRTEYFEPQREIVDYANWLRSQWWVATECDILLGDMPVEDPGHWLPTDRAPARRPHASHSAVRRSRRFIARNCLELDGVAQSPSAGLFHSTRTRQCGKRSYGRHRS